MNAYLNIRPLMKMRITRVRKEFGHEGVSFIDKDAVEGAIDIKP